MRGWTSILNHEHPRVNSSMPGTMALWHMPVASNVQHADFTYLNATLEVAWGTGGLDKTATRASAARSPCTAASSHSRCAA